MPNFLSIPCSCLPLACFINVFELLYCFTKSLTSCSVRPAPLAMRFLLDSLIISGFLFSSCRPTVFSLDSHQPEVLNLEPFLILLVCLPYQESFLRNL